jgi:predicted amidohydrolase
MKTIRIAAAQTPEYRDDIPAAIAHACDVIKVAWAQGALLVCFPEGYLQGYMTDEASARRVALDLSSSEFARFIGLLPMNGILVIMGVIEVDAENLFNTAVVIKDGSVIGHYRKRHLLDGEHCFTPGIEASIFDVDGLRFGINICHDTNFSDVGRELASLGASVIICPANNMMPREKANIYKERHNEVRGALCRETGLWLVSADVTGTRGNRVGLGPTAVLSPEGEIAAQLPDQQPGLLVFDLPAGF